MLQTYLMKGCRYGAALLLYKACMRIGHFVFPDFISFPELLGIFPLSLYLFIVYYRHR